MGEAGFWRVTVIWPRPRAYGRPRADGYLRYDFDHPGALEKVYAMLLPGGAALEAIELRARMVRFTARISAEAARRRVTGRQSYAASSQVAIEVAVRAAHFGYYASGSPRLGYTVARARADQDGTGWGRPEDPELSYPSGTMALLCGTRTRDERTT